MERKSPNISIDSEKGLNNQGVSNSTGNIVEISRDNSIANSSTFSLNESEKQTISDKIMKRDNILMLDSSESMRGIKKKGIFNYPYEGKDYSATYFYDDAYFKKSSYEYNASLATMSMCLAWSAMASDNENSYVNKSVNAKNLLEDIGFGHFDTNAFYTEKPGTDSIGVVAAYKKLKNEDDTETTLIAVAIRGGGYEREWASNFTLGESGDHKGFSEARTNVIKFLKQYISDKKITGDIKLWITGYSRAAATANLVAGSLDIGDESLGDNVLLDPHNLYAYCNEAPSGTLNVSSINPHAPKYRNIFNIINPCDPATKVAPPCFNFTRYGVDKILDSQESTSEKHYNEHKKLMLSFFNKLESTKSYSYNVDNFKMKKIQLENCFPGVKKVSIVQDDLEKNWGQSHFLNNYFKSIFLEFVKTRKNYVNTLQSNIRNACKIVFGNTKKEQDILIYTIENDAKTYWYKCALAFLFKSESDAYKVVGEWINDGVKKAGITNISESDVNRLSVVLCDYLLAIMSNHPSYATTFVLNSSSISQAHYPELCYSWLASRDYNYTDDAFPDELPTKKAYGIGPSDKLPTEAYRVIRINCPVNVNTNCHVNVEVFDKDKNLVAAIINDVPQPIKNSSMISSINEDGEKEVFLPVDYNYSLKLTATGKGEVNCSIVEYSYASNDYVRIVNYYNIPVVVGDVIFGVVPAINDSDRRNKLIEGSTVNYELFDNDKKLIVSDSDKKGEDVASAYYYVNVTSNDENSIVLGGGYFMEGSFTKLIAMSTDEKKEFKGWYIDDKCVSTYSEYRPDEKRESKEGDIHDKCILTYSEYRFCVRNDVIIEAHFK